MTQSIRLEEGLKGCDLSAYISKYINAPFKWGRNDCITFTVEWLELQTGKDYLTEHRPWRTARQAHKKLRDLRGLFFLFDENLTRIHPNMALDGDLTIHQDAAHIFSGRHIVSVGKEGLMFTDRTVAKEAWTCRQ